jgi:hypothetical protein
MLKAATAAVPLVEVDAQPASTAVPWFIWCAAAAVTSAMWGVHWDIAWHRSIGRDTFWTPPHLAIQLCAVLGAVAAAYLILATTFGARPDGRAASVRMWGFTGPLGAFITAWGGVAMLTSAPFDNWWHSAYGLDVKIISPPHALLALGIFTVELGSLILILGFMNRASGALKQRLEWLFLYVGAMILVILTTFLMEHTDTSEMHMAEFYAVLAVPVPFVLVGVSWATTGRWAATRLAALYSAFYLLTLWIFPLVATEPKLGPVYYPVKHLVPAGFPLLVIAPALAIDGWRARSSARGALVQGLIAGALYFVAFLGVQWPFASFLQSPWARNAVFGSHYFDFSTRPYWYSFNHQFAPAGTPRHVLTVMMFALVLALVSSRIGVAWGNWMSRIKR